MEGSGSIGFDLTGTIAQYRQEIKRIRNELTEREADLAALERVQTIKVREMGLDRVERVEPKVMAFHIGRYMKDHAVDTITPKDALSIVGNAPFFDGLADKTKHVYVTRALSYEVMFQRVGRGEYSLSEDAADRFRPEVILKDNQGYFFMTVEELKPGKPRRYGVPLANVYCESGQIAVIDGKLMHFIDGQRHFYDAELLFGRASDPPDGLNIVLDS